MNTKDLKEDLGNVVLDDGLTAAQANALTIVFQSFLEIWQCDPWVIIMAAQIAIGRIFSRWEAECQHYRSSQKEDKCQGCKQDPN